ncbi:MAG TPA: Uma2 family endonuclease [Chloroflexota bacterium]|nr:Uma2 family endonuclease [Chloroflexota bacterium]
MAITRQGIGLAEFLELPEEKPALEYEAGRITQKVSPKAKHGRLQFWIASLIESAASAGRLGMVFTELRTTFAGASRVPDVAYYRSDRLPRQEDGELANDALTPPDLAVEIRSPEQSMRSQLQRCRDYVRDGVRLVLAVDPETRRVWVVGVGLAERELAANEAVDLSAAVPGLTLSPSRIFEGLGIN